MTRVAILVAVFLTRMEDFKKLLDNLFEDKNIEYDVFIYTYKRYEKYISYFKNVRIVRYIEDNEECVKRENKIRTLSQPSNIFQYYNLQICFKMMEKYMVNNNITFDFIYRIRPNSDTTQYIKPDMSIPLFLPKISEDDVLYAKSDQYYVGSYNAMKKVVNMCDYIMDNYYGVDKQNQYWEINYETISKSDMNTIRFDMLVYPSIININDIESFTRAKRINGDITPYINSKNKLRTAIRKNLKQLKKYKYTKGDKLVTSSSGSKNRAFRAEKSFVHYVTSICNLIIKELPNIRWGG